MPKVDTLGALGIAITKILTANIQDMPQICPRYPSQSEEINILDMPNICLRYAKYMPNMPKICSRYAQDMPKVCSRYAQYMPKICQNYAQDMFKILIQYSCRKKNTQKHKKRQPPIFSGFSPASAGVDAVKGFRGEILK